MKRTIVMAVVALIVGLGGGVGWSFAHTRPPVKAVGQSAADSTVANQAPPDSTSTDAPQADSARIDSTRVTAVHADSVPASPRARGTTVGKCQPSVGDSADRRMTGAAVRVPPVRVGVQRLPTPLRPPVSGGIITAAMPTEIPRVDTARVGRLARLFAAMSAKDAARVLLALDQADAQLVLSAIDNRHAAEILSNFPPDRAAEMSKLVLRPSQP
ncbi:MAG TPA: hypothetical protein VMV51_00510 [Gemmatimonadaceae bacterium]|nr:hypothetical protein [Gemmatimonadaceae bacterium]